MNFRFSPKKTIQASAVLLKQHAGRMSRLRLLKMLVIADREALAATLEPITADRVTAMDHGPVLSQTYNMLKGMSSDSSLWDQYISQEGPQDHRLICDPGVGSLSRYEIDKLIEICDRFRNKNDYDLANYTHEFQEWQKNKPPEGSSRPIPLEDILEALGMTDKVERLKATIKEEHELDRLFGAART